MQKVRYGSNLNLEKTTLKMGSQFEREMCQQNESRIHNGISKDEWRNLNIQVCLEEELEEVMDHVICYHLEEGVHHRDLDDLTNY